MRPIMLRNRVDDADVRDAVRGIGLPDPDPDTRRLIFDRALALSQTLPATRRRARPRLWAVLLAALALSGSGVVVWAAASAWGHSSHVPPRPLPMVPMDRRTIPPRSPLATYARPGRDQAHATQMRLGHPSYFSLAAGETGWIAIPSGTHLVSVGTRYALDWTILAESGRPLGGQRDLGKPNPNGGGSFGDAPIPGRAGVRHLWLRVTATSANTTLTATFGVEFSAWQPPPRKGPPPGPVPSPRPQAMPGERDYVAIVHSQFGPKGMPGGVGINQYSVTWDVYDDATPTAQAMLDLLGAMPKSFSAQRELVVHVGGGSPSSWRYLQLRWNRTGEVFYYSGRPQDPPDPPHSLSLELGINSPSVYRRVTSRNVVSSDVTTDTVDQASRGTGEPLRQLQKRLRLR